MIDPTTLRNWALALVACGSLIGGAAAYGHRLIAQEARREAARQMAPATRELSEIKDLLRRQEDREELKYCRDYKYRDEPEAIRARECERESEARWIRWRAEDAAADTASDGS